MYRLSSESLSDSDLLESLKRGDKNSFTLIYTRFWKKLYLSAYSILKNQQAAEDIVQEVMVSLWLRRSAVHIDNLNAYLYQSTRFQVFKFIRNNKFKQALTLDSINITTPNEGELAVEFEEVSKALSDAVDRLPERCRDIFILRKQENMSVREIADQLKLSPKTVENQLTIAYKKIKIFFEENSQETLFPVVFFCFLSY